MKRKGTEMNNQQNDDIFLRAEVYQERINDMQARIYRFAVESPGYMNDEIREINRQLSLARTEARIKVDEEHFKKWDDLLQSADAAMIKSRLCDKDLGDEVERDWYC